ncbi:MAG: HAMP domain-containing histidine kinase [Campylobacterales bacterium]|nr:HAMP domain-containing histidine kinase [Campylobacterales bacterium]
MNELNIEKLNEILIHQSKLASLGEMIANIAHQWRQPIAELNAILMNIKTANRFSDLSSEKLEQKLDDAEDLLVYMSNTIEDFRNFFSIDKKKDYFSLQNCINKTLNILKSSFKQHHIEVFVDEFEDINIYGYANEFSTVLLNLLANAKDVAIERKIKRAKISIKIFNSNNIKKISIIDNCGGVKVEPIEKIFEPYYTTKPSNIGTGIGLYICKNIIKNRFSSEIDVKNLKNGAKFTISLKNCF